MGSLAEMNRWAETVASRDDAPFLKGTDSVIFVPDTRVAGSTGHYENQRTGVDGIATPEEFAQAFYDDPHELAARVPGYELQPGMVVTGFRTWERMVVRGEVAGAPFYTIRRTPDMYSIEQTTGSPGGSRGYNPKAMKFNTYVGTLWLAIDYPSESDTVRTHVSLFTVSRDAHQEITRTSGALIQLVFGEESVAQALAGRFRQR